MTRLRRAARHVLGPARPGPNVPRAARQWAGNTFSQTGEDRIVSFVFGELGVSTPSYLDIGAYHPFRFSNTALLHAGGSRGINVEPDPSAAELLRKHRPGDLTLNVGCGAEPGRLIFYRMSESTLSTFSRESAEQTEHESGGRHRVIAELDVDVLTVQGLLDRVGQATPDFVSIDVEGLDFPILESLGQWPGLPTVICVETVSYSEHGNGVKDERIPELLAQHGYAAFADTYLNTIFVLQDRWTNH